MLSIHNGILQSGQLIVENIRFLCNGMKWISILQCCFQMFIAILRTLDLGIIWYGIWHIYSCWFVLFGKELDIVIGLCFASVCLCKLTQIRHSDRFSALLGFWINTKFLQQFLTSHHRTRKGCFVIGHLIICCVVIHLTHILFNENLPFNILRSQVFDWQRRLGKCLWHQSYALNALKLPSENIFIKLIIFWQIQK